MPRLLGRRSAAPRLCPTCGYRLLGGADEACPMCARLEHLRTVAFGPAMRPVPSVQHSSDHSVLFRLGTSTLIVVASAATGALVALLLSLR